MGDRQDGDYGYDGDYVAAMLLLLAEAVPGLAPAQALAMDALLAESLLLEHARRQQRRVEAITRGRREAGDGTWQHRPDGSRVLNIKSMKTLGTFVKGGYR